MVQIISTQVDNPAQNTNFFYITYPVEGPYNLTVAFNSIYSVSGGIGLVLTEILSFKHFCLHDNDNNLYLHMSTDVQWSVTLIILQN